MKKVPSRAEFYQAQAYKFDYIQLRRQKYETVTVCQDKKSGGDFVQFFEHKIETFSSRENFKKTLFDFI